ncbi:MAG: DUF4230 domain-containing protein [Bergeyella sp.]
MKNYKPILYFALGIVFMLLLFFVLNKLPKFSGKKENTDYYILTNQITKMNKMVVLEQDFTSLQKTNVTYEFLGSKISNNEIVTFTKTNAQVSYDLNKMQLDVDSTAKKLIIKSLPEPEIRVTPNVEIKSMDDSFFNRIDEAQIKKVTQTAKDNALKQINQEQLKAEGRKQLAENLNQVFVLAKALNYTIEDRTGNINLSEL